jgi:hypothetical protein
MQKSIVVVILLLITITAHAQLRVRSFQGYHEHNGTIPFGSVTAQYCTKLTITIENLGTKRISLSTITLDGDDFLISGNLPEYLGQQPIPLWMFCFIQCPKVIRAVC